MNKFIINALEYIAFILICICHILVRVPVIPFIVCIAIYYLCGKGLVCGDNYDIPKSFQVLFDWYAKGLPSKYSVGL